MNISAENIGKKFGKNWIFRGITKQINSGDRIVITGPNGAGKSTLLQIISGFLSPSEGEILHDEEKPEEKKFSPIGYSAPYLEVPEEMTFSEFLTFHAHFRKRNLSNEEIADQAFLPLNQVISEFSTGMKQRVQLSTVFYFQNQLVCMDEPTANLDVDGYNWWKKEMQALNMTLVVASNQEREIDLFENQLNLAESKAKKPRKNSIKS